MTPKGELIKIMEQVDQAVPLEPNPLHSNDAPLKGKGQKHRELVAAQHIDGNVDVAPPGVAEIANSWDFFIDEYFYDEPYGFAIDIFGSQEEEEED